MSRLTNEPEARELLSRKLEELKELGYEALRETRGEYRGKFLGIEVYVGGTSHRDEEEVAASGILYQFEIGIDEDAEPDHVLVHITLFEEREVKRTLEAGFTMAPDGRVVNDWPPSVP